MRLVLLMACGVCLAACGSDRESTPEALCPLVEIQGDGVVDSQVAQLTTKLFSRGDVQPTVSATANLYAERSDATRLPASLEICGGPATPATLFARIWGFASDGALAAASPTMVRVDVAAGETLTTQVTTVGVSQADIADAAKRTAYIQSTLSQLCFAGPATAGAEVIQDQCRVGTAHFYDRREYLGTDSTVLTQLRVHGTNLCLEIPGGSTAQRARAALGVCSDAPADNAHEQLLFIESSGGSSRLRMLHSLLCLNVDNSSLSAGAVIQQFTCGDFNNQNFGLSWSLGAF